MDTVKMIERPISLLTITSDLVTQHESSVSMVFRSTSVATIYEAKNDAKTPKMAQNVIWKI